MANWIKNLEQLKKTPMGTVVFYKNSHIFDKQDDSYYMGIVVSSNHPSLLQERLKMAFLEAMQKTYASPVMGEIRVHSSGWANNWDREPDYACLIGEYEGMSERKILITASAPVPENGIIAQKFAIGLEEILSHKNLLLD